jgi:hypothetical protein
LGFSSIDGTFDGIRITIARAIIIKTGTIKYAREMPR